MLALDDPKVFPNHTILLISLLSLATRENSPTSTPALLAQCAAHRSPRRQHASETSSREVCGWDKRQEPCTASEAPTLRSPCPEPALPAVRGDVAAAAAAGGCGTGNRSISRAVPRLQLPKGSCRLAAVTEPWAPLSGPQPQPLDWAARAGWFPCV